MSESDFFVWSATFLSLQIPMLAHWITLGEGTCKRREMRGSIRAQWLGRPVICLLKALVQHSSNHRIVLETGLQYGTLHVLEQNNQRCTKTQLSTAGLDATKEVYNDSIR
jgi:hypothetical protein